MTDSEDVNVDDQYKSIVDTFYFNENRIGDTYKDILTNILSHTDVNTPDVFNETPMGFAIVREFDQEVYSLLIDCGADRTRAFYQAMMFENPSAIQALLKYDDGKYDLKDALKQSERMKTDDIEYILTQHIKEKRRQLADELRVIFPEMVAREIVT